MGGGSRVFRIREWEGRKKKKKMSSELGCGYSIF